MHARTQMSDSRCLVEGIYCTLDLYGDTVLYEHMDYVKGGVTRNSCEAHLAKRNKQVGKLITYLRGGHYHEHIAYGRGRVIINGSVPGQDSYAEINGYDSEAVQVINYYVETKMTHHNV